MKKNIKKLYFFDKKNSLDFIDSMDFHNNSLF